MTVVRYADFGVWQKEYSRGPEYEKHVKYWLAYLGGELPTLDLPTDHPRPPVPSRKGGLVYITVSPKIASSLSELAKGHYTTLYVLLLAAYHTLLHRYTGQEDIIIGTAVGDRATPEIQNLIGFFVNTLAMRTSIVGDMKFTQLLASMLTTTIANFEHQEVPFDEVVSRLGIHRSLAIHPICQAFFVLQNLPARKEFCGFDTVPLRSMAMDTVARFDLTLEITKTSSGGLECAFEFARDLFEEATIRAMAKHFTNLLESIVQVCLVFLKLLYIYNYFLYSASPFAC